MKTKLFGLFKSPTAHDEEDQNQREFAMSQDKDTQIKDVQDEKPEVAISEEVITFAQDKLKTILDMANFSSATITRVPYSKGIRLVIEDEENMSRIIGRDGATIDSLQILIKAMIMTKFKESAPIQIDAGDYRNQKIEKAKSQALRQAAYITEQHIKEELPAMNSAERFAIHTLFQDHSTIKSYSVGTGRDRRIVLELK